MRAAVFEQFQQPLSIQNVATPKPSSHGAVISVKACGICRSDWHGWKGHDSDVDLPHVPGHELSGVIAELGAEVSKWKVGDRVTVPFCCGCGTCEQCAAGYEHICDNYTQPGFTQWGAFAEYVAIDFADVNLIALPETVDFVTAASLGCRFATSFRGIVQQGRVAAGETVAVFGCGGVGLSAVMIAASLGARVVAIDINPARLSMAKACGAEVPLNANDVVNVVEAVRDLTSGGVHASMDALGSRQTCFDSISVLRKRGRHVQIGLTLGEDTDPPIPMSAVIGKELEIVGSHGMAPAGYVHILEMIADGKLNPAQLITDRVTLDDACDLLPRLNEFPGEGVTVIDRF